jgi:integrase
MMTRRRSRGEGAVTQLPDGRWQARLDLGWQHGKRVRKAFYGRTRREVLDRLLRARADLARGLRPPPDRLTVAQHLATWLETAVRPTARPPTYRSYTYVVRRHLAPGLGALPLARLDAPAVRAFLQDRLAAGLSPRTVQLCHAVLRRALTVAERDGLVPRNVARLVTPPRAPRAAVQPLTVAEARALLAAAHGERWEALVVTALYLGLRQGELLGLRWCDVDLAAGRLRVVGQVQRVQGALAWTAPKSARSQRTLELPRAVAEALRAHRARQAAERLRAGALWQPPAWGADLVFTTQTGGALDARNVVRWYHRLLARAGLPRRPFHHLRHTAASLLLAEGCDLRTVQHVLGHSQVSLTADLYTHVMPTLLRDAAARLDAALGS